MKGAPQRPGPNGSRVVRKRLSTPRLGAGLSAIAMQIGSFSRLGEMPVANELADGILPRSGSVDNEILTPKVKPNDAMAVDVRNDVKPFIAEPMVRTGDPIIDNETADDSMLCDSPVSSTDEDGFDASCNSLDGNHPSSPNSTPPPSNDEVHRKNNQLLATTKMNNYPRQRIADYISSHQPLSDLTNQLQSTTPLYAENFSNNGCLPTVRSAAVAPYNGAITTGGTGGPPVLGPTSAQLERLFEATQRFRDTNRLKVSDDQSPDRLGVAERHSPIQQSSQCSSVFASNSRLCDIMSASRPSEVNYISYVPPCPYTKLNPQIADPAPTSQPPQPFTVWSKEDKRSLLEFKLTRFVLEDSERASAGVHIFVDMSNILVGFINTVKTALGVPLGQYLRTPMSFEHLARILERGRNIQKRVLAGSLAFPASRRENWPPHLREAESMGYEMNIFDRVIVEKISPKFKRQRRTSSCRATLYNANDVASADDSTEDGVVAKVTRKKGEQGVDENLHLNMMNSIIDNTSPGTMVLATGDAAQAQFSGGFKYYATRALERGWMLEVVSWNRTMSSAWYDTDFMAKYGDRIRIIELDEFIEELHAGYPA
ncbi:hypothetical protein DL769_002569 [Monosporascus sp. CRB-8-3]|nr:hypothetical protein DL769_002569 [Monosporascus sp. CRB-8-3]